MDDDKIGSPIVDIKVAQPNIVYSLSSKLIKMEASRQKLLLILKKVWNANLLPNSSMKLGAVRDMFREMTKEKEVDKDDPYRVRDAKRCLKIVNKLLEIHNTIKYIERDLDSHREDKRWIQSVFVTFRLRSDKKLIKTVIPRTRTEGFLFCYKKIQLYETVKINRSKTSRTGSKIGAKPEPVSEVNLAKLESGKVKTANITAKDPVDPLNINWNHLDRPLRSKIQRRILSWSLYLLFYAVRNIPYLTHPAIYTFLFFKTRKQFHQTFTPNCSAFSSILSRSEIFEMVDEWKPRKDALKCLCLSRKELVTESM